MKNIILILLIIFGMHSCKEKKLKIIKSKPIFKTTVLVTYKDRSKDTIIVNVYKRLDNIQLENGDLTYWKKYEGDRTWMDSRKITICSFVRNFKIIEYEKIINGDSGDNDISE